MNFQKLSRIFIRKKQKRTGETHEQLPKGLGLQPVSGCNLDNSMENLENPCYLYFSAMTKRIISLILIFWLLTLALPVRSQGASQDRRRQPGMLQEQTTTDRDNEMIRPSGLQPVFPTQVRCPEIASPFGSQTRYDGSRRPSWEFGGYHGGMDISLAEGTPLLALAAGTVVAKGEGGQMEGNYLWLRHSPEDTGLTYWSYSKYQHLQSLAELAIGARVVVGQVVARSGKTGTTGGHFGAFGYPHLHLTMRKSLKDDLIVGSRGSTGGANLFDPLMIYHEAPLKPQESVDPPLGGKAVAIPYVATDGRIWPQGTRLVWPVACQP